MTKMNNALQTILRAGAALLLLLSIGARAQDPPDQRRAAHVARALDSVMEKLISETKVPLRLPSFIPFENDPSAHLYGILRSASEFSYQVELSWEPECSGGNNCHFGTIRGSNRPFERQEQSRKSIVLRPGLRGWFTPSVCGGAGCSDSTISWAENNFYYYVSMKGGKRAELTKMAQSALEYKPIAAGHR